MPGISARSSTRWRDDDGRPFVHTYFYPAEQYDRGLLQRLASHCNAGWGEIEIHLHHGLTIPDNEENTRRQLAGVSRCSGVRAWQLSAI